MAMQLSSWQSSFFVGIAAASIVLGCWCLDSAREDGQTACPALATDSQALLQLASGSQKSAVDIVEDHPPFAKVIWSVVISLDPDCCRLGEGPLILFEMYTAAVKSLYDHQNHRIFAPFLLAHMPPSVTLEDVHEDVKHQLTLLEHLGVTVVPFTSTFYKPRKAAHDGMLATAGIDAKGWECAVASYARLDAPQVLLNASVFHSGHFNSTHMLHTDMDVLWQARVTDEDWWSLAPENGCPLAMSYDIRPNREKPFTALNGGVVVMEIEEFVKYTPHIVKYAVQQHFLFHAFDQTLLDEVLTGTPPKCASVLSAAWNYKPWWGLHTREVVDGLNVPVTPKLMHLQGLHPSSGLLCSARKAVDPNIHCAVQANESIGLMSGAEGIQHEIDIDYKANGYEMLLKALEYYYKMLGQDIADVN